MKELTIYIQQILFSLHAIPLHVNVDSLENGYMVECSFVKKSPNLCSSFQLAVEKNYSYDDLKKLLEFKISEALPN